MNELTKPPQQNISKEFLRVFNRRSGFFTEIHPMDQIYDLKKEPTKKELTFSVETIPVEIFLFHLTDKRRWKMIEGDRHRIIVPTEIESQADILAHSHLQVGKDMGELPAPEDTDTAKGQFIIHTNGLTYFTPMIRHPLTGEAWRLYNLEEILAPPITTTNGRKSIEIRLGIRILAGLATPLFFGR